MAGKPLLRVARTHCHVATPVHAPGVLVVRADIQLKRTLAFFWGYVSHAQTCVVAGRGQAMAKYVGDAVADVGGTITCDILYLIGWDGFAPLCQVTVVMWVWRRGCGGAGVRVVGCGCGWRA